MTARTFGRKGQGQDEEMARRREAFIAEERARKARLQEEAPGAGGTQAGAPFGAAGAAPTGPIVVREKSIGAAYLFWFFFGAVGAHRFYLGYPISGVVLAGIWMTCWMMLLAGFVLAVPVMIFTGLWILGDAFFIPGLHRKANARARDNAVQYVFI